MIGTELIYINNESMQKWRTVPLVDFYKAIIDDEIARHTNEEIFSFFSILYGKKYNHYLDLDMIQILQAIQTTYI